MTTPFIPADITAHCQKHVGCKGCPVAPCVPDITNASEWLERKIEQIRYYNSRCDKTIDMLETE